MVLLSLTIKELITKNYFIMYLINIIYDCKKLFVQRFVEFTKNTQFLSLM